jgi:hypothetical protein
MLGTSASSLIYRVCELDLYGLGEVKRQVSVNTISKFLVLIKMGNLSKNDSYLVKKDSAAGS